jgi:hypothetical protein
VLVKDETGQNWIERYAAGTGALVGRTPVGPAVSPSLDIAGMRIVYSVGREIRVIRLDNGRAHLVHTPVRTPRDLQIEGTRIVWYTVGAGTARVHEIVLPRL